MRIAALSPRKMISFTTPNQQFLIADLKGSDENSCTSFLQQRCLFRNQNWLSNSFALKGQKPGRNDASRYLAPKGQNLNGKCFLPICNPVHKISDDTTLTQCFAPPGQIKYIRCIFYQASTPSGSDIIHVLAGGAILVLVHQSKPAFIEFLCPEGAKAW